MAKPQNETPSSGGNNSPPDKLSDAKSLDPNNPGGDQNTDPISMLTSDHRHVEQLFDAFEKSTSTGEKSHLSVQICNELMVHTLIEEEMFYPACQDHMDRRLLDEAQVEHDGAKALIREVQSGSPEDQYFDAKVKVLSEDIKHHVREEEKPGDGIFAKAKAASIATPELAKRMAARKQELMQEAEAGTLGPPEMLSFRARTNTGTNSASKENQMARSSTMDRDNRGRDDHDDRDYRRSSGRSQYDDDYRRMPPRDEEGRFMSRDDHDGRRS
jgi:hemerythrin superfamily protein